MTSYTGDAALAVQRAMNVVTRERILSKFRGTNLNGADVADILDILGNQDWGLEYTEPFYEGAEDACRVALGWPTRDEDSDSMRWALLGASVLAIALLTDAVPTPGAVIRMTRSAAIFARVDTFGGGR